MDHDAGLELLRFLEPNDESMAILVIESTKYLPQLRRLFPNASLYAVVSDDEEKVHYIEDDLQISWSVLDYREEMLPFSRHFFDVIISERMLENVANPQDIASGIGTFIKDTGCLLTSFENIRCVKVLRELMDGHYYAIVRRRYAKPEFERLLYASFYKDIFFAPLRISPSNNDINFFMEAGFENRLNDLATEVWLVQAMRSSSGAAALKAEYTSEIRNRIAILLRRIEYDIECEKSVQALWKLIESEGITINYLAFFATEIVIHKEEFLSALYASSPEFRHVDIGIISAYMDRSR